MNEIGENENQIMVLVLSAIEKVKKENEIVYHLLYEHLQNGFFEQNQSKGKLDSLAKKIVNTVVTDKDES